MYKKIYIFIILLLLLPLIDNFFKLIPNKKLEGEITISQNVKFDFNKFLSGEYQSSKEKYLNENLNMYDFVVRLNNTINFYLFKKTTVVHSILGKENILFDVTYIDAFYGKDLISKEKREARKLQFNYLKRVLNYYEKDLFVCFLPGKPHFYKKQIPDYLVAEKGLTNLDFFQDLLKKENIPYLNLTDYLLKVNDTSKIVIYPKESIHISDYASILATDTLIKFIENKTKKDIPNIKIDKLNITKYPEKFDADILLANNLLFYPKFNTVFAHPKISFTKSKDKLRLITIGDSFFKYLKLDSIEKYSFGDGPFWFYGKINWPEKTSIFEQDLRKEFINSDAFLIYSVDATLYLFPYNLSSKILEQIIPLDEKWITEFYEIALKTNPDWTKLIKEKAQKNKVSFDEQKKKEINYMTHQYLKKHNDLYQKIKAMKSDTAWYNLIVKKAKENDISINTQMLKDAYYILNEDKNKQK